MSEDTRIWLVALPTGLLLYWFVGRHFARWVNQMVDQVFARITR